MRCANDDTNATTALRALSGKGGEIDISPRTPGYSRLGIRGSGLLLFGTLRDALGRALRREKQNNQFLMITSFAFAALKELE